MLYESKTFRLEADDQVLTLWLDFRGRSSHSLTLPILHELSLVFDRIAMLPAYDAILIRSSSPHSFLEEFDSAELCRFSSPLQFAALARRGQDVARKLEGLGATTIAVIEGRCAGAGLEFALACDYRLAVDSAATRFESPEVSRGLVPCCGGTYRLPRIAGIKIATWLLCERESMAATAARQCGLVNAVTDTSRADIDIQSQVDRLREQPKKHRRPRLWHNLSRLLMRVDSARLRRRHSRSACNSGSAEDEVLAAIVRGYSSEAEALATERAAFARLASSESTRALLDLHRQATVPVKVVPEPINPVPPLPRRIGIVGASELATFLTWRLTRLGHEVVIRDRDIESGRVSQALAGLMRESVRRGEVTRTEARRIQHAIGVTSDWVGFENADLVIEAVDEDPGVKRNLFQDLENRVRPRVPLVSASSIVPVEGVQAEMTRPGRIAGLSFPNPFDSQPLAEVVGTSLTDPGIVCALMDWARTWGFTPVRVADRPGRLVELVRLTYLAEGVTLVAEGLPIDRVDIACRQLGMARGPLEWCDEIGLDRLAERTAQLQLARGDGFARCLLFQRLLSCGSVGKSVGEGLYRYGMRRTPSRVARMILWQDLDDDATAPYVFDPEAALQEGIDRIVLRTVNEAARALVDEPDADPATVDLAIAYGMGWAPHRGGPLRYADHQGIQTVVDRLSLFAERFGSRFVPCDELVRRAEAGESFYPGTPVESQMPTWRMVG